MRGSVLGIVASGLFLAGCEQQCEHGYKIKTEYHTIFFHESWNASPDDKILDGAVRISASTFKDGRALIVRCFKLKPEDKGGFDLRYEIDVPLLARFVPEMQKAGEVELVVNVDGVTVGSYKAIVAAHDFGISFLAGVDLASIEKLGAAQRKIIVMPRQGDKAQDDVIDFGVAELAKHIGPVKEACKTANVTAK
jgi:hypothetical protein